MQRSARFGRVARLALGAVVLLALGLGLVASGELSPETLVTRHAELIAWRDARGAVAVLGFFAATLAAAFVSLPGIAVFTLAGGLLFGVLWGTLLVTVAATLGATGLFALTRLGVGESLWRRLDRGRGEAVAEMLKRNEITVLLLLRLAPVVPFFLANTLPAVAGVGLRRFVVTTFVGLLPGTAAIALAGAGIGEAWARGGLPDGGMLAAVLVGVPLALLAVAVAARILARRLRPPGAAER